MSIEKAITTIVTTDAAITGVIGNRLFPLFLPQGAAMPAVVYQEISGSDGMTTDGALGLVDGRFQFTCWSATHTGAVELRDAVISLFKANLSGVFGGVTIQAAQVIGRGDIQSLSDQAEGLTRYGKYVEVTISYNE